MKLSICIVHYHSEKYLERFLDSLFRFPPDDDYEVLVVDNGSRVDLAKHLHQKYGDRVKVFNFGGNLGFGKAQNMVIKKAKGEYVFICNPDLELRDDSLKTLMKFAEQQRNFGIIGPKLLYDGGGVQESCRRFPSLTDLVFKRLGLTPVFKKRVGRYLMHDVNLDRAIEVDWLVGAAMMMRRKVFLELGGFDERFFLFFEDTDLCRRAGEKGYSVWYHPDARFVHTRKRLSESEIPGMWLFQKTFWIHLGSAIKYFNKWKT